MALRLVMMGTGRFALPAFRAVLDSPHTTVGLFTQPDRQGRGHHHHVNPLKELALERGVEVFQPEKVNQPDSLADLRRLNADLCVVAAYGQILSAELLGIPRLGAINLHASILPKYRGAAPVQTAILRSETETGVTIFQIEPKLDAGPMLALVRTPIGRKETSGELEERLAVLGAELIPGLLRDLESGSLTPLVQDASQATRAPRLEKEDGQIDWGQTVAEIDCRVRALQPWPLAYSTWTPARIAEVTAAKPVRVIVLDVEAAGIQSVIDPPEPGTVLALERDKLIVQAGDGPLEVMRLRPEGKRDMTAAEFLRGYRVQTGDRFRPA